MIPDVSVIIVNYCTPTLTNQAIRSVFQGSTNITKELYLVDNASHDDSLMQFHQAWGDKITLISNKTNQGFAKANNQAMRCAKGRYFLLLNSDAEVSEGAIEKMVCYADTHSEAGIIGCRVVSADGNQQASCWRPYTLTYLACRSLNLYRLIPDGWFGCTNIESYGKPKITCKVKVVSGCIMLARREAVEKVGYFDERFFMYCEDMDWCTRMWQSGYEVHYLNEATILHRGGGTSASIPGQMSVAQSRSTLLYLKKNYGNLVCALANLYLLLFFLFRLPVWILFYLIFHNRLKAKNKISSYVCSIRWHVKHIFNNAI